MAKQKYTLKFKIDYSRVKSGKLKHPPKPIKKSKWAEELFKIGAGWKNE